MDKNNTTQLWNDYQNGVKYQSTLGLSDKIPEYVDFYEGRQWPKATERTKTMPRPVINIIKMICRNKKAAILSVPVKIIYKSDDTSVDMIAFNRFAEYIQKEIGQEMLDKRAIDDGVKKGSYFYHYYWDAEARGMRGEKIGGLRCEIIDPLNIFFSNPQENDEQKQEWIIIASREKVDAVKAKCDSDADKESILPDECEDKYHKTEQDGSKLCTVLTRYFRKDGEVYCEKATKSIVVNKPFAITPNIDEAMQELDHGDGDDPDAPNNALPDDPNESEHKAKQLRPKREGSYLYPIVAGCYEYREKSIYGIGEVEGLIPNQKAINFNLGMMLLSAQETAWGKYIVLPDALRGQQISNEPGQVLIDWTKTGTGIRKMNEQSQQSMPLTVLQEIINLTRSATGATEVMSGETLGANMSGAAIAQLQAQSQKPIEDLRNTFWRIKEKQGKVLAQFFKHFYLHREYSFTEYSQQEHSDIHGTDFFDSEKYIGKEINVITEATSGTNASTAGDINVLDTLYAKGEIDAETYIRNYPEDAIGNKESLMQSVKEAKMSENAMLKAQNEELQQGIETLRQQAQTTIKQLTEKIQSDQKTVAQVSAVIRENEDLRKQIANLYVNYKNLESEATQKIDYANRQIKAGNAAYKETRADAEQMAEQIYRNGDYTVGEGNKNVNI